MLVCVCVPTCMCVCSCVCVYVCVCMCVYIHIGIEQFAVCGETVFPDHYNLGTVTHSTWPCSRTFLTPTHTEKCIFSVDYGKKTKLQSVVFTTVSGEPQKC